MFSHSHLGLPSGLFPASLPAEIVYLFIYQLSHSCYMPTHFIFPVSLLDPYFLFNITLKHPKSRKSYVSWDITLCSPLKAIQCSGGMYLLPPSCWFIVWHTLQLSRWRQHVPLKHQLTFGGLHDVISQKIELFITTAVRTPNPTLNLYSLKMRD
jgi:hypothetical protein